jgi:uncharacterized membrane protein YkvA (DUF1232 family)
MKRSRPVNPMPIGYLRAIFRFFKDPGASGWGKLFVLATIVYVVSPIDLIPDIAPIIGWLDDLGLAGVAMMYLARVAGRYREASVLEQARPKAMPPKHEEGVVEAYGVPVYDTYSS